MRQLRVVQVVRFFPKAATTNRVVYAGTYPTDAWEKWGDENKNVFQPPYVTPFSDLT